MSKKMSFSRWLSLAIKNIPNEISEWHKETIEYLKSPENWEFLLLIVLIANFPVFMISTIMFFPYGIAMLPFLILFDLYVWYRTEDRTEETNHKEETKGEI